MSSRSRYDSLKDEIANLVQIAEESNYEFDDISDLVTGPENFNGLEHNPSAMSSIGYIQGYADSMDMTVLELLDYMEDDG